ncbi:hypothetical protein KVR01_002440 [Diaporthe batatas]|uniref:uncharacterized protein n=1 Tax=Diaporthe batatas TaxID=748121 RepID=UPI001D052490|nr:uncharacterized protein KVR01_002440 [Diaporthe batatas]KAG8166751.1 hypothetical protein KVR01_002440 [Diaporthe batatas]
MRLTNIVFLCAASAGAGAFAQADEVDVLIVGGGATGAYAAVRIREDFNKTVLVVEKTNRMGGHVHTYSSGNDRPVNYGVQAYLNRQTTADFFKRFDMDLINPDLTDYIELLLLTKNVDFESGTSVDVDYGPVDPLGIPIAFLRYLALAIEYQPWFENGYFKTGDVPGDLLLPFGEFLEKHDLGASLGILRNLLWLSDALNTPTWFVMSVAGKPQIAAFGLGITGPSFKWPETYSSETLFDRVLTFLGDDVLLQSTIASSQRTDGGVIATIQTPTGQRTVQAKRILFAATPSPDNTAPWDLDENETTLFNKFSWETLYVGVVNGTGLPTDVTGIRNSPDNSSAFYLPEGSFCDAFDRQGDRDLWSTRIIGEAGLSAKDAETLIIQSLTNIDQAGTYDIATPAVVAFANHGSTVPKVSPEELSAGFFNKLYALQGQRSTYWTGLAWAPDYTPILCKHHFSPFTNSRLSCFGMF